MHDPLDTTSFASVSAPEVGHYPDPNADDGDGSGIIVALIVGMGLVGLLVGVGFVIGRWM